MTEPILVAAGLKKSFAARQGPVEAVRGVSLSLGAGEVLAFLGPNGAGKTTTLKMLLGLVRPDAGSVRILGLDPHADSRALLHVGAVLEGSRNLYWRLTAEENLEYFAALRGVRRKEARRRSAELLELLGLGSRRRSVVQGLSRGMQQSLAIAVALVHEPPLLFLDEPTLGLDVEAADRIERTLRQLALAGRAVLLTTHQLEVAERLSGRVAILRSGLVIAEETTEALLRAHSGGGWRIELESEPDAARVARLLGLGAVGVGRRWSHPGPADRLFDVLEALRPLPLLRVERDRADLGSVFRRLLGLEATPCD